MKRKIFIGVLIAITLFLFILLNFLQGEKVKEVEIEILKKGEIAEIVKMEGKIKAYKQVEVGSDVMGRIEKIMVKERQKVKKGEILCIISPETYRARVLEMEARIEADLSKYEVLKNEYERAKELFTKNLISKSEFERIESEYLSMKSLLKSDSFILKEAKENLEKCYIRSVIDGEVLSINKEEGEMAVVGINVPGNVIMVIADRSKLFVNGEINENEISKIKKGDSAVVKVSAFEGKEFKGIVENVSGVPVSSSGIEAQGTAFFPIKILLIESDSLLLPGMNASCEIITKKKNDVLTLPYSAIGKEKDKHFVFVKRKGKAEKRFVSIGIQGKEKVEITDGVSENDTIIIGPQKVLNSLKQGERVKVKK
jgi:HlyD family secretion protein